MHKPKHYEYAQSGSIAVTTQTSLFSETLPEAVNIHGLRGDICLGCPTSGGGVVANWALVCIPEFVTVTPSIDNSLFNTDELQSLIWASGRVMVANSEVRHIPLELHTSRNCEKGSKIIFIVRHTDDWAGVTPDLVASIGIVWWETQS